MIGSASRGTDSTNVGAGMAHGVRPKKSSAINIRGTEAKAVKTLLSCVDSMSFDVGMFAVVLSMSPIAMQKRLLSILYVYFEHLAERFEKGLYMDDEEMELYANGARARDSLIHFM